MKYKQQKGIRNKLDIYKIISNSNFFMIVQIRSHNIYEWLNLKKKLVNFDIKIKACSINIFKNNKCIFTNKIIIVHSTNLNFIFFSKQINFFINLFIFFKNRFLFPNIFKKIVLSNQKKASLIFFLKYLENYKTQPILLLNVIKIK